MSAPVKRNPSQRLGELLRVMEEHVGAGAVEMPGSGFEHLYRTLTEIRLDVIALENHELLRPRPAEAPPWGWGPNVVALDRGRGPRS